jgi:hypothetical protein
MKTPTSKPALRCAIYTRVSTDARLEQEFNSLDAQREASEAYIKSQTHESWSLVRARYDDGGFSGGSMERPALQKLLLEVQAKRIDVIVVYKVDRLTRYRAASPLAGDSPGNGSIGSIMVGVAEIAWIGFDNQILREIRYLRYIRQPAANNAGQ